MNGKNPLVAARQSITDAQRAFTAACEDADRILEARLNEAALEVSQSATTVGCLQNELDMLLGLEQDRRAASVRLEIASAEGSYRATVDRAKVLQHQAWEAHLAAIAAAVTKMASASVVAA